MKTYVWLSKEKLKFINDTPQVVSLLYDLGLLPEEISARVRAYVKEETRVLSLQVKDMQEIVDAAMNENWPRVRAATAIYQRRKVHETRKTSQKKVEGKHENA